MKLKTISAISLTLASLNAFAYIASPGVKEENVKIHCSHPGNCWFVSRDDLAKQEREKFVLLKKKKIMTRDISADNDMLETYAFCSNAVGHINQPTKITGYHVVNIENNSGKIERFTIKYEIYSDEDDIYYEKEITLNPNDYYTDSFDSFENIFRNKPGIYNIVAMTSVDGAARGLDLHSAQLSILDQ